MKMIACVFSSIWLHVIVLESQVASNAYFKALYPGNELVASTQVI